MSNRADSRKVVLFAVMASLVLLNLVTFIEAYPEIQVNNSGCCSNRPLAKDFSAFYVGAWRLLHDASNVYTPGAVDDGGPVVLPQPETYKYLPSFLVMVVPLLALGYQQALIAFDVFQFLLLPLIALLIYKLVGEKGAAVTIVVAIVVLLQPLPLFNWGLSASYYWQWAEGQSKVLETFLILLSLYLGKSDRPFVSGVVLALSAFDPRFALAALPLFVMYNRARLREALLASAAVFLFTNAALLFPGVGSGFVTMLLSVGLSTPIYYYALIPLLTILSITLVNLREVVSAFRGRKILTESESSPY
ncbi:MAG: glycosyltransferase 87 family protein [Thaumarchaeota archaeon]|nr:glycosyltransferase 87 family protein [Nitrososphaerota archaeon]